MAERGSAVRPITVTGHPETIAWHSGVRQSTAAASELNVANDACHRTITANQAAADVAARFVRRIHYCAAN